MWSIKDKQQHRLQFLYNASQTTFNESPAISAHIASRIGPLLDQTGGQLQDTTWRKICACCGYTLIPGWTAMVRMRGLDTQQEAEKQATTYSKAKPILGVSMLPPKPEKITSDRERIYSESFKAKRKRSKRTRGRKQRQAGDEAQGGTKDTTTDDIRYGRARKMLMTKPKVSMKEPRIVMTCKICNRKTLQAVPIQPAPATRTPTNGMVPPGETLRASPRVEAKPPFTIPLSDAPAKKRAKARKSTLAEMLAKEQATQDAANRANQGFGFDLMDFMKTA